MMDWSGMAMDDAALVEDIRQRIAYGFITVDPQGRAIPPIDDPVVLKAIETKDDDLLKAIYSADYHAHDVFGLVGGKNKGGLTTVVVRGDSGSYFVKSLRYYDDSEGTIVFTMKGVLGE